MHFQATTPNWPTALLKMPDWSLVKAVNNPSILREARQRWSAAGRDDAKLFTIFRKVGDYNGAAPAELDFAAMCAWWRAHYFTWCDGTYLREYAPFVTAVEEANEYTDNELAHNPALLEPRLRSALAAVDVWNSEFRGRVVHSPDGGEGLIPAACRLVIGNVPVGNDVPRQFMQLAIASDSIVGYHAYTHWINSARDPGDWRWHSGRWSFNEAEYGLKPIWAFTETGPYKNTSEGWKSHGVCDGSLPLLLEAFRAWARDVAATAAYAEGRLMGLGAFFTSGHVGWENYQLDEPQLSPIAQTLCTIWRPGQGDDIMAVIVDQTKKARALAIVDELKTLIDPPAAHVWKAGDVAVAVANPIQIYNGFPGATPYGVPRSNYTADEQVLAVSADGVWLQVLASPVLSVRAEDVKYKGS